MGMYRGWIKEEEEEENHGGAREEGLMGNVEKRLETREDKESEHGERYIYIHIFVVFFFANEKSNNLCDFAFISKWTYKRFVSLISRTDL